METKKKRKPKAGNASQSTCSLESKSVTKLADPPLRIGAFNLHKFGKLRHNVTDISNILMDVLKRYDILLVMEERTGTPSNIDRLIKQIDTIDQTNPFDFKQCESLCSMHGREEQYCFFYRRHKLSVLHVHSYDEGPFSLSGWHRNSKSAFHHSASEQVLTPCYTLDNSQSTVGSNTSVTRKTSRRDGLEASVSFDLSSNIPPYDLRQARQSVERFLSTDSIKMVGRLLGKVSSSPVDNLVKVPAISSLTEQLQTPSSSSSLSDQQAIESKDHPLQPVGVRKSRESLNLPLTMICQEEALDKENISHDNHKDVTPSITEELQDSVDRDEDFFFQIGLKKSHSHFDLPRFSRQQSADSEETLQGDLKIQEKDIVYEDEDAMVHLGHEKTESHIDLPEFSNHESSELLVDTAGDNDSTDDVNKDSCGFNIGLRKSQSYVNLPAFCRRQSEQLERDSIIAESFEDSDDVPLFVVGLRKSHSQVNLPRTARRQSQFIPRDSYHEDDDDEDDDDDDDDDNSDGEYRDDGRFAIGLRKSKSHVDLPKTAIRLSLQIGPEAFEEDASSSDYYKTNSQSSSDQFANGLLDQRSTDACPFRNGLSDRTDESLGDRVLGDANSISFSHVEQQIKNETENLHKEQYDEVVDSALRYASFPATTVDRGQGLVRQISLNNDSLDEDEESPAITIGIRKSASHLNLIHFARRQSVKIEMELRRQSDAESTILEKDPLANDGQSSLSSDDIPLVSLRRKSLSCVELSQSERPLEEERKCYRETEDVANIDENVDVEIGLRKSVPCLNITKLTRGGILRNSTPNALKTVEKDTHGPQSSVLFANTTEIWELPNFSEGFSDEEQQIGGRIYDPPIEQKKPQEMTSTIRSFSIEKEPERDHTAVKVTLQNSSSSINLLDKAGFHFLDDDSPQQDPNANSSHTDSTMDEAFECLSRDHDHFVEVDKLQQVLINTPPKHFHHPCQGQTWRAQDRNVQRVREADPLSVDMPTEGKATYTQTEPSVQESTSDKVRTSWLACCSRSASTESHVDNSQRAQIMSRKTERGKGKGKHTTTDTKQGTNVKNGDTTIDRAETGNNSGHNSTDTRRTKSQAEKHGQWENTGDDPQSPKGVNQNARVIAENYDKERYLFSPGYLLTVKNLTDFAEKNGMKANPVYKPASHLKVCGASHTKARRWSVTNNRTGLLMRRPESPTYSDSLCADCHSRLGTGSTKHKATLTCMAEAFFRGFRKIKTKVASLYSLPVQSCAESKHFDKRRGQLLEKKPVVAQIQNLREKNRDKREQITRACGSGTKEKNWENKHETIVESKVCKKTTDSSNVMCGDNAIFTCTDTAKSSTCLEKLGTKSRSPLAGNDSSRSSQRHGGNHVIHSVTWTSQMSLSDPDNDRILTKSSVEATLRRVEVTTSTHITHVAWLKNDSDTLTESLESNHKNSFKETYTDSITDTHSDSLLNTHTDIFKDTHVDTHRNSKCHDYCTTLSRKPSAGNMSTSCQTVHKHNRPIDNTTAKETLPTRNTSLTMGNTTCCQAAFTENIRYTQNNIENIFNQIPPTENTMHKKSVHIESTKKRYSDSAESRCWYNENPDNICVCKDSTEKRQTDNAVKRLSDRNTKSQSCGQPNRRDHNHNADIDHLCYRLLTSNHQDEMKLGRVFCRRPFAVHFLSPLADLREFAVLAIHTSACMANNELQAIQRIYDITCHKWYIQDVLIMGDFDGDPELPHWKGVSIKSDRRFTDLLQSDNKFAPPCRETNYDRFLLAGRDLNRVFISSSAGAYKYDKELALTDQQAATVSDHYPIELQLAGMATTRWQKHVRTSGGVVIQQVHAISTSADLKRLCRVVLGGKTGFTGEVLHDGRTECEKEVRISRSKVCDVVECLKDFQRHFPDILNDTTITVASSFVSSPWMTSSPVYGLKFEQDVKYDVLLTVTLQQPHMCNVRILRHICDGFSDDDETRRCYWSS